MVTVVVRHFNTARITFGIRSCTSCLLARGLPEGGDLLLLLPVVSTPGVVRGDFGPPAALPDPPFLFLFFFPFLGVAGIFLKKM